MLPGFSCRKKEKKKEAAIKAARFVNFANSIDFLEKMRLSAEKIIHIRNERAMQMIPRQERKEKQKEIKKKNQKPVRERVFALLNEHIIIEGSRLWQRDAGTSSIYLKEEKL